MKFKSNAQRKAVMAKLKGINLRKSKFSKSFFKRIIKKEKDTPHQKKIELNVDKINRDYGKLLNVIDKKYTIGENQNKTFSKDLTELADKHERFIRKTNTKNELNLINNKFKPNWKALRTVIKLTPREFKSKSRNSRRRGSDSIPVNYDGSLNVDANHATPW